MKSRLTLLVAVAGLALLASPTLAGTDCAAICGADGHAAKCVVQLAGNEGHRAKTLRFFGGDEEGAYLGVTLAQVDKDTAEDAGLDEEMGALIRSVFDDTPAAEAGMQAGDIVTEFDGERIESVKQLVELVGGHEAGDEVKVVVRRDGGKKSFSVTLADKENSWTFSMDDEDGHFGWRGLDGMKWKGNNAHFGSSRARLGVEVRDLDDDLAEYFDGSDGDGALVMSVFDGSAAEAAGLKPGDVLTKLNDLDIDDVADLRHAVKKASGEGEVELEYLRKGKRKSVEVTIEESEPMRHQMRGMPHLTRGADKHFLHEMMEDVEMDEEHLRKVIEKLEQRLEKLEERLEDDN